MILNKCSAYIGENSERIATILLYAYILIVGVILFVILNARTPFYINNQDPSYLYLSSFAVLGSGDYTDFVDNPGFTMHIIGTVISKIIYFVRQDGLSYPESIIIHSEYYLYVISICMNMLILLGLLAFVHMIKSSFKSGWSVLLAVVFVTLGSSFTIYRMTGVSSEAPLILVTILGVGWIIRYTYSDLIRRDRYYHGLISGLFIALTIGTKLTALPVIGIYLLVLETWKQRFVALVSALIVWSGFWLMATPSIAYYIGFLEQIFLGGENYGTEQLSLIQYGENMLRTGFSDPLLVMSVAAMILIFGILCFKLPIVKNRLLSPDIESRLFILTLIAVLGHFFIVGKQFRQHYLLTGVIPLAIPLVIWINSKYLNRLPRYSYPLSFVLVVLMLGVFNAWKTTQIILFADSRDDKELISNYEHYPKKYPLISHQSNITLSNAYRYFGVFNKNIHFNTIIQNNIQGRTEDSVEVLDQLFAAMIRENDRVWLVRPIDQDFDYSGAKLIESYQNRTYQLGLYESVK